MRLRVTFSKAGPLRYSGHLDLHKTWERTTLRAGLPLAYSQGFHPGPKIQLACALPLGFLGRAELVDLWLEPESEVWRLRIPEVLQAAAPPGLTILAVEEVDAHLPALQTQMASAEYEVTLLDPADAADLTRRLSAVMEAASLPRQRRGKGYDLRPLIESLTVSPPLPAPLGDAPPGFARGASRGEGQGVRVFMRLSAREGATGRPEEVLDALGIPFEATRVERTRLILRNDLQSTA
jgi:radical SAM-linked protein